MNISNSCLKLNATKLNDLLSERSISNIPADNEYNIYNRDITDSAYTDNDQLANILESNLKCPKFKIAHCHGLFEKPWDKYRWLKL